MITDGLNARPLDLGDRRLIKAPGGTRLASDRSILNCPAIGFLTVPPQGDQAPPAPSIP